jgi:enamine deaminase RidA (YjgF/YER057c/UK114 family)
MSELKPWTRRGGAVPEDMNTKLKLWCENGRSFKRDWLSLEAMIKHTIYMTKGSANLIDVIVSFTMNTNAPGLKKRPVRELWRIEGLAVPTFKIEVDAVAAYPD